MGILKTSKSYNVFRLSTCLCTDISNKHIKQNNKVVLLDMALSSCSKTVQSVVYLITSLPWFYFIIFTFISLQDFSVSAVSSFVAYTTEVSKGSHELVSCWREDYCCSCFSVLNNNFLIAQNFICFTLKQQSLETVQFFHLTKLR